MNNSSYENTSQSLNNFPLFVIPREHRIALWIIDSLGSLLGVSGNLFVLIVLISSKKMHSKTNMLLMSLILSGLLIALILQPIRADQMNPLFTVGLPFNVASGVSIVSYLSCIFSILSVISERFIAVLKPLRYLHFVTSTRIKIVLVFIWLPSIIAGITLYEEKYRPIFDKIALISFTFVIFISVIMYSYIFYVVQKQKSFMSRHSATSFNSTKNRNLRADNNSTTVVATFVSIFVILWLPTLIYLYLMETVLYDRRGDVNMFIIGQYLISLHLWNGSINWYVYCWKCKSFRNIVKKQRKEDHSYEDTAMKTMLS